MRSIKIFIAICCIYVITSLYFCDTYAERLSRKETIHYLELLNNANALLREHKYHEAINLYEHIICALPFCAMAYFNKGIALLCSNQENQALICLKKTIELDPWHAKAHYEVAQLLYKNKEFTLASFHYSLARAINPYC
jgi:tetratricopeptide (TPR) repeat protein